MSASSSDLKPIERPLTSPSLRDCQASSRRFLRSPGSSVWAMRALISMPSAVTDAAKTSPIGSRLLCCQRSGIGRVKEAPPGSTMSPARSVDGVEAMPVMMR